MKTLFLYFFKVLAKTEQNLLGFDRSPKIIMESSHFVHEGAFIASTMGAADLARRSENKAEIDQILDKSNYSPSENHLETNRNSPNLDQISLPDSAVLLNQPHPSTVIQEREKEALEYNKITSEPKQEVWVDDDTLKAKYFVIEEKSSELSGILSTSREEISGDENLKIQLSHIQEKKEEPREFESVIPTPEEEPPEDEKLEAEFPIIQDKKEDFPEFDKIIQKLKKRILEDDEFKLEELKNYIPALATNSNEYDNAFNASDQKTVDLLKICEDFISSELITLILTGDAGIGKSLFTKYLVKILCNKLNTKSLIPLWIPLLLIDEKDRRINLLEAGLRRIGFDNFDEIRILKKANIPFLLILDGYDEIHSLENFYITNNLSEYPGLQIIITCRKEALNGLRDYTCFNPSANESGLSKLQEYRLLPFNDTKIEEYIRNYVFNSPQWDVETYLSYFKKLPDLVDIVRNPYILGVVIRNMPTIIEKHFGKNTHETKDCESNPRLLSPLITKLTRREIYQIAMNEWFDRQAKKIIKQDGASKAGITSITLVPVLKQKTKELASELFDRRDYCIRYNPLDLKKGLESSVEIKTKISKKSTATFPLNSSTSEFKGKSRNQDVWISHYFSDNKEDMLFYIMQGYPIRPAGEYQYVFHHTSLIEFFAAEYLFDGVLLNSWMMTGINLNARCLTHEKEILHNLIERVCEPEFKNVLMEIILTSRYERHVWRAAANAVTILNMAGVSFSGMNLSRIRVGGIENDEGKGQKKPIYWGADLSGAILDHADLKETDLRFVNLSGASMRNTRFDGSCLEMISLAEQSFIQFTVETRKSNYGILSSEEIHRMFCSRSPGNQYFIGIEPDEHLIGKDDQYIRVYSAQTKQLLQRIKITNTQVGSLFIAFSKNDRILVVVNIHANEIKSFDPESGQPRGRLTNLNISDTLSICLNNLGNLLAIGGGDGLIQIYNLEHKEVQVIRKFKHDQSRVIWVLLRDQDNRLISAGTDGNLIFWDFKNGNQVCRLRELRKVSDNYSKKDLQATWVYPRLTHSDNLLAVAKADNQITVWDIRKAKPLCTFKGHSGEIYDLAMGMDSEHLYLASIAADNTARVWDITEKREHRKIDLDQKISDKVEIQLSPNGHYILMSTSGKALVDFWDIRNGMKLRSWCREGLGKLSFVSDNLVMNAKINTIDFWDINFTLGMERIKKVVTHSEPVTCLSVNKSVTILASGSEDCSVRLWDLETGTPLRKFTGHTKKINAVVFDQNDEKLISGSEDKTIKIWDIITGECVSSIEDKVSDFSIKNLVFNRLDRLVSVSSIEPKSDSTMLKTKLKQWDYKKWLSRGEIEFKTDSESKSKLKLSNEIESRLLIKLARMVEELRVQVESRNYNNRDSSLLFVSTLSESGAKFGWFFELEFMLHVWDVELNKKILDLDITDDSFYSLTFNTSGTQIAAGGFYGRVSIWDLKTGKKIYRIETSYSNRANITALTYTRDDKQIIAGDNYGTLFFIDWLKKQIIFSFSINPLANTAINALIYLINKKEESLITGDDSNAIHLWKIIRHEENSHLRLQWRATEPRLSFVDSSIHEVSGLAESHTTLFRQHRATGEPSKREPSKILIERDSQRVINGGIIQLPNLDKQHVFTVDSNRWLISLVRKRRKTDEKTTKTKASVFTIGADRHVTLIIQGVQRTGDELFYSVIKEINFYINLDKPHFLGGMSGKALIRIQDKTPRELEFEDKSNTYIAKNFSILKTEAESLLGNVEKDMNSDITYGLRGGSSLFSGHNCLTYCEEQLQKIGVDPKDAGWVDFICAFPEKHIPDPEQEQKNCLIM